MLREVVGLLLSLAAAPALACNATASCGWPYSNPYTAHYTVTADGRQLDERGGALDCCAVMPVLPLVDTGTGAAVRTVPPPSMDTPGAVCPEWPDEIVLAQGLNPWRNGSLYKTERIFFVDGLDSRGPEDHAIPKTGFAKCAKAHPFYTKYVLARSPGSEVLDGIPVLGSAAAPDAALLTAAATISEMLRQADTKLPGLRREMVRKGQRFAVWADAERRTDTCKKCMKINPLFDCGSHIDSRAGRDTSFHPEVPECVEGGGGASLSGPTSFTEEYGIPYLEANGSVRDSYCGTNIVAHEFFHSMHEAGIQSVARPLFMRIEQAAARATKQGIYVHHPGAKDDGCNDDFTRCVAYEFIVKAHMLWNGFPADPRELPYRSRAEMKKKAPWIAQLVYKIFEDGDWNPARGTVISKPRDQTFGLTCKTAPGSALCGGPLSDEYIGPPMAEVLRKCGGNCWNPKAARAVTV